MQMMVAWPSFGWEAGLLEVTMCYDAELALVWEL